MADKKQATYRLRQLKRVKTWQLLIIFILSVFVSTAFLRLNNIGMIERRDAVLSADIVGDSEKTKERLYDLQRYVTSHMNTDMGNGVYLGETYKKDVAAAYALASVDTNPNGNIYKKAQDVCRPKFDHWSMAYIQCTINEIAKYPSSDNLISSVQIPRADIYSHNYVSPVWSADFAGWSVMVSVVILIIIIIRLTGVILLKAIIRHRYKSI